MFSRQEKNRLIQRQRPKATNDLQPPRAGDDSLAGLPGSRFATGCKSLGGRGRESGSDLLNFRLLCREAALRERARDPTEKKGDGSSSLPLQTIILTGILGATADAPAKKRRLPANSGLKSTRPRALGGWNVQHFLPRASANQRARLALPEDSTAARHSQSEESSPARLPRALLHRRDFAKRCADCARESGIPRVEIFNFFLSRELRSK